MREKCQYNEQDVPRIVSRLALNMLSFVRLRLIRRRKEVPRMEPNFDAPLIYCTALTHAYPYVSFQTSSHSVHMDAASDNHVITGRQSFWFGRRDSWALGLVRVMRDVRDWERNIRWPTKCSLVCAEMLAGLLTGERVLCHFMSHNLWPFHLR